MRRSLLWLPVAALLFVLASSFGRLSEGAIATPGENDTTYTRVRMIAAHREGFETLIVEPEYELSGAAAREVTIDEALAAPTAEAAEKMKAATTSREEARRAKLKALPAGEARELKKQWDDARDALEKAHGVSEFSKTYAERFKGVVGLCSWQYGDAPGKVSIWRLQEATEAIVWAEGLSAHAVLCVQSALALGAYESVLENPEDIAFTYSVTPNPAARPQRLAWVIPVPGEPLAFAKAPAKIIDEVDHATEELLPAPPPADVIAGLPPPRIEPVAGGEIVTVPGQGAQAGENVKRLLAQGQFGSIRDVDLEKYRGDWKFLLYKVNGPVPLRGALEPVGVTFRAEKLTLPGRIYGGGGIKQAQVWVYSDRIIPPAALRQFGFTFQGKTTEDGREDGIDYQTKHVPASLAGIWRGNARLAPPLAALAGAGALYRLDGFPLAVQPGVWSSECELAFSTFSSPRHLPDSVHAAEDEAAKAREGGCGCRTAGPGAAAAPFALLAVTLLRASRRSRARRRT
jgi:hypothetical protein